ncbi:hypothetical protein HPB48_026272 [Haemaphysalis longicornis]|uniref:Uncharacterized protein n=1 Tax=Haemaphysalis longicornis TaxID=44386 RepID=A0A9J6H0R0_HAELO|nr:hypothetical protein HPB48_026272 [Haemaphysalis longicornis]
MQTIIHQYQCSGEDVTCTLRNRYFPDTPKEALPTYSGPPDAIIDQPIIPVEVLAALAKI